MAQAHSAQTTHQVEADAHEEHKHPPINTYLKVWGILFVMSALLYFSDIAEMNTALKRFLATTFSLVKAGFIVSYFMHLKFERLSLIYAILLPPLLLLALAGILAAEGQYILGLRTLFGGGGP